MEIGIEFSLKPLEMPKELALLDDSVPHVLLCASTSLYKPCYSLNCTCILLASAKRNQGDFINLSASTCHR